MGKRMVPTPAGLRVLQAARTALPAPEAAAAEVRLIASGRAVVLRLSTECYTCYHWLPTILRSYNASRQQEKRSRENIAHFSSLGPAASAGVRTANSSPVRRMSAVTRSQLK